MYTGSKFMCTYAVHTLIYSTGRFSLFSPLDFAKLIIFGTNKFYFCIWRKWRVAVETLACANVSAQFAKLTLAEPRISECLNYASEINAKNVISVSFMGENLSNPHHRSKIKLFICPNRVKPSNFGRTCKYGQISTFIIQQSILESLSQNAV